MVEKVGLKHQAQDMSGEIENDKLHSRPSLFTWIDGIQLFVAIVKIRSIDLLEPQGSISAWITSCRHSLGLKTSPNFSSFELYELLAPKIPHTEDCYNYTLELHIFILFFQGSTMTANP